MINLREFVASQEGKIFIAGVLLFFGYCTSVVVVYLFSWQDANDLIIMSFTNFFFGRAAGISYGYSAEFNDNVIVGMNMMIEFIMVLIIYPLFVLSFNKSVNIAFLRKFFIEIKKQRRKYKDFFDKYGKYGLFLFVWFPFWMTGPVVGAIVGFLIGLKHYQSIFIVLSGTSLAIFVWTYFLKELTFFLNQYNSNSSYLILGLFILIGVVLKLMKTRKQ